MMSTFRLAQEVIRQLLAGCGDSSCRFKKPTGMATNGGCRCVQRVDDALLSERAAAREQALEEAAKVADREQSWWEEAVANREAGRSSGPVEDAWRYVGWFRSLAQRIRALKRPPR